MKGPGGEEIGGLLSNLSKLHFCSVSIIKGIAPVYLLLQSNNFWIFGHSNPTVEPLLSLPPPSLFFFAELVYFLRRERFFRKKKCELAPLRPPRSDVDEERRLRQKMITRKRENDIYSNSDHTFQTLRPDLPRGRSSRSEFPVTPQQHQNRFWLSYVYVPPIRCKTRQKYSSS